MKDKDPVNEKMSLSDINTHLLLDKNEKNKTYEYIINPKTNELEKYGFYRSVYHSYEVMAEEDDTREEMEAQLQSMIDIAINENKELLDSGNGRILIRSNADNQRSRTKKERANPNRRHINCFTVNVIEYSDKPMEDKIKYNGDHDDAYVDLQLARISSNGTFGPSRDDKYRNGLRARRNEPFNESNVFSYMRSKHHFKETRKWFEEEAEAGRVELESKDEWREIYKLNEPLTVKLNSDDEYNCKVNKVCFATYGNPEGYTTREP